MGHGVNNCLCPWRSDGKEEGGCLVRVLELDGILLRHCLLVPAQPLRHESEHQCYLLQL